MPIKGDFIRVTAPKREVYGIFDEPSATGVKFVTYDLGIPLRMDEKIMFMGLQSPGADSLMVGEVITKDVFLNGIAKAKQRLEQRLEQGGLAAACWASRMYCIDKVAEFLQEHAMLPLGFVPEAAATGIYVVHTRPLTAEPETCGVAPEDLIEKGYHFQGVRAEPALPSVRLTRVLANAFPRGFGSIPEGAYFNDKGPNGTVYGYFTYSIPESAAAYVENPIELNFNPQEASTPKKAAKKKAAKKKAKKKKKS